MSIAEIFQIIINNGMGLGVAVYFLFKDWKQSEQIIDGEKKRAEVDAAQTEVMRQLCNTIEELRRTVEKIGGGMTK